MTTCILAGGADKKNPSYNTELAAEVRKIAPGPLRVLSCFFAEPREVWEGKVASRTDWFKTVFGADTQITLAFPDVFAEQIEACDLVYLHGGDDVLLETYLNRYPDLAELWRDKIVIGSSAGANYLAVKYWTCDWRMVRTGSGLSGLNVIPHFESETYGKEDPRGPIDWQAAKAELQAVVGDETVTVVSEGEFTVVTV
jgi:hypothetical protein